MDLIPFYLMLIYCSNSIFFLYSQPLLYRFVDIVHEAPLSGQWQPRSIVNICQLSFVLLIVIDHVIISVSCQRDYLRSSFTLVFIHETICFLYLLSTIHHQVEFALTGQFSKLSLLTCQLCKDIVADMVLKHHNYVDLI